MAATRGRTYRMSLRDFYRYLEDKRSELAACYKDVEEVQFEFNEIFRQEMAAWQEAVSYCFPRMVTQRDELPADLVQRIDRTEEEERARIRAEIADLEAKVAALQERSDALLREGQEATERLKRMNPELDAREEELKARMAAYQTEYAEVYEQLERLESPLAWLTRGGALRALRREQARIKREQALTLNELRQVREEWTTRLQEVSDAQSALREQWQQASVELAEAQARLEHLQTNLDALAQQAGLQRVLEELEEAPAVPGEFGAKLAEVAARNRTRREYEEGLAAVAETLGLTKGVGEGLARFQRSVGTVLEEQRRYNLKSVQVTLPAAVVATNEIWSQLGAKVRDEKAMGRDPLAFSRIVKGYISEYLSDAQIQSLFETMGEALNRATKAWG
ncbi:MAG TPA: hypothetical protein GX714_12130 [Chloroflexi bacterium]|nr:hypothetical protein [Chloroflexota bacterium]